MLLVPQRYTPQTALKPLKLIHQTVLLLIPPNAYNSGPSHWAPAHFYNSVQSPSLSLQHCGRLPTSPYVHSDPPQIHTPHSSLYHHVTSLIKTPQLITLSFQQDLQACLCFHLSLSPSHQPPHPTGFLQKHQSSFPTVEQLEMFLPYVNGLLSTFRSWLKCHLLIEALPDHPILKRLSTTPPPLLHSIISPGLFLLWHSSEIIIIHTSVYSLVYRRLSRQTVSSHHHILSP